MNEVPIFQVDAFTSKAFGGNPAAVCPLTSFLSDDILQAIARENNLPETAFLVPQTSGAADGTTAFALRWFTPTVEVELCGHATLGAGHIIFNHIAPEAETIHFETLSGRLTVNRARDRLSMALPNLAPSPIKTPDGLGAALGAEPRMALHRGRDYLLFYDDAAIIESMSPDMNALAEFAPYGFIVTAAGSDGVDFISRGFFPNHGIPEDPVTGSAHCLLAPFWADRLGRTSLHALQVSSRGGELWLDVTDDHVVMSGHVVETMRGTILLS